MSLIISDAFLVAKTKQDSIDTDAAENLAKLDHYLAILEENKRANRFIPNDAGLALDMAGFVRNQLGKGSRRPGHSLARLALALVQKDVLTPVQ